MDQCYSSVLLGKKKDSTPSRIEGGLTQNTRRAEKPAAQFWFLFLYVFSPPPMPALCKLGQPGGLLVLPEVLTPVLGPSFLLFSWAFPFFVF